MDLKTTYLGLELPHPFIAGASPLGKSLDRARSVEDAGASALVLHSLFEEQFARYQAGQEAHVEQYENTYSEATSYFASTVEYHFGPDQYLEHLRSVKEALDIPVIASLNGTRPGTWVEYARNMQDAGADAIELNLYYQPNVAEESASAVEARLLDIVKAVCASMDLPVAVKLSPFFTSLPNFAEQLKLAGAKAAVLFNRFYQPDIDLDELETIPFLELSNSSELLLRLRWLAMLFGRQELDLSVTGGVHTFMDAAKSLMAGASTVQLVSCLLKKGPARLGELKLDLEAWMEEKEYRDLQQMIGSMSYVNAPNPESIERANYLKILQSWAS
jgi:dihydroorotate dehydrogenase (fumarate)